MQCLCIPAEGDIAITVTKVWGQRDGTNVPYKTFPYTFIREELS